ncbi:ATP-grasp ribosomal peptide maturase [Streptomyces sp. MAR4 CNX-425]|uniref:ATP-grasp ribosomal peptide maturase n=1 Tax=Streptomyces sp. MAR4 CNX-425 TaxID=3406343 RepID=UPI003B50E0FE
MRDPSTVLVLTHDEDRTAERVSAELTARGVRVAQFDAADFPTRIALAAAFDGSSAHWTGQLTGVTAAGRRLGVDLADVAGVYYRRPTQFQLEPGMSGPEQVFAYGEARRGFGGVLMGLGCTWVNDPVRAAACEYKPLQLAAAAASGLRVPASVITNDPEHAAAWARDLGRPVIYKPLSGVWVPEDRQIKVLYTSVIDDPETLREGGVELTAHLLQEWVEKSHEARAVVVGDRVFTVAIHADSARGHVDWRSDYDALRYEKFELPAAVRRGLVELHRRLGLLYGACDLIVTPAGEVVFLEVNQNGEWGWLAAECDLPIASALADVLQAGCA